MKKYVIKEGYLPETKAFIKATIKEINDSEMSFRYLDELAESYEVRERAKASVNKEGISLTNSFTGAKRKNPLLRIIQAKDNLIARYLRMLRSESVKHKNAEKRQKNDSMTDEEKEAFETELYELDYSWAWKKSHPNEPFPFERAMELIQADYIIGDREYMAENGFKVEDL